MPKPQRFLERFWSLYIVGRNGALHTIGYALLGLFRLAGLFLITAVFLLVMIWLVPGLAGHLFALVFLIGIIIFVIKIILRLITGNFRQ